MNFITHNVIVQYFGKLI